MVLADDGLGLPANGRIRIVFARFAQDGSDVRM
jgi:hypothetical protein